MKRRYKEGRFTKNARGLGTVTEAMVLERARELALTKGRSEHQVLESDLKQAKQELTSPQHGDPPPTPPESITEEERWEVVADASGKQTENIPAPDEQTFAEKLVSEGVDEAEHERRVRAVKDSNQRDRTPES